MANRYRNELRKALVKRYNDTDRPTLAQIAKEFELPGRQWVYYYIKTADYAEAEQNRGDISDSAA